jgi:hypothetical protein
MRKEKRERLQKHFLVSDLPAMSMFNLLMVCHLTGSANGIAAAYFLLQHKNQLGGSKSIWKVRIFLSDDEDSLPDQYNMLFFVDGTTDPAGDSDGDDSDGHAQGQADVTKGKFESTVTKRNIDGKSFIREHIFRAKF